MNQAQQAQLQQFLRQRRDTLAESWYQSLVRTSFSPRRATDVRQRLRDLMDDLIDLLLTGSPDSRQAESIGAALAQLHYLKPEALGNTLNLFLRELAGDASAGADATTHPALGELLSAMATGFVRQARATVLAEQETIRGALLLERQRVEAARQTSEAQFRAIFDGAAIGMTLADMAGYPVLSNLALQTMLGYTADELCAMRFTEFTHPDDVAADVELFHELVAGTRDHYQMEKRYIRKNGSLVWGHLTVSLVRRADGDPRFVIGMVEDITARKQAEAALRESEACYCLIAENANDVICVLDQAGRFIYASPSFQRVLGDDPQDVIGTTPFDRIHPDDRLLALERWKQLSTRESMEVTCRYRRADDAWRWLEASATLTIRGDETVVVAVGRDITERRDLETHLQTVQKMDSVGRLASGAAHEFNNQLTGISAYVDFAMKSLPTDHEVQHDLEEIQQITQRAAQLARQLLTFARKEPAAPRTIDLNDHIREMIRFLRRLIGEDIELTPILTPEPALVNVDPGQYEQLIVNVALNARDAMPDGGRLLIETSHVVVDVEYARRHTDMHAGPYVLLTISDTGIGMTPEVQAHIFDPFFTTKDSDEGTGLGLAIAYGIVKQHEGSIWVYSEPQHGTTFKIYLPRSMHGAGEALSPLDLADELPDGIETVLLVEDEPTILGLTAQMLRSLGYTVLEASNGDEALRAAQAYSETPIHILLTDLVLPKLSGQRVAERLIRLRPGIKVLFTSGYTEHVVLQHGRFAYDVAFLQKPFRYATLARKIREVLDS